MVERANNGKHFTMCCVEYIAQKSFCDARWANSHRFLEKNGEFRWNVA